MQQVVFYHHISCTVKSSHEKAAGEVLRLPRWPAIREALRQLPERERQVIALRFYHGLTQQRAAGILHISQVQVSRLERRAVERLREWLAT